VVYFPMDIDRTFWEVLSPDHGLLLRNAVDWATNEERPLRVTGPGLIDVALWRQRDSVTAHLVNLTNPMTMKGPYREICPIGPLDVEMRLPAGRKAKAVKLLSDGRSVNMQVRDAAVHVRVPSVSVHEVVAVELEG
jgi:hypothetical protein